MKSFTLLTLFSMLSTGFQNNTSVSNHLAQTGYSVISSFKHGSVEEYCALMPSLSEFHQMMDSNDKLYGGFLEEAKREFSKEYNRELAPSVKEAFNSVIAAGHKHGIDWTNVEFVRVETIEIQAEEKLAQLDIVFRESGKEYKLRIENAFVWQGEWRVTQFIHLMI